MKEIHLTKIQFPEIMLSPRDAHKLRGYFGNLFKHRSPLLHNHYETGELRYRYPLVQYKVVRNTPTLVALNEGAELLTKLFMQIRELELDGRKYEIFSKNIESKKEQIGYSAELHEYRFDTRWMALNQSNYRRYLDADEKERKSMLSKILVGNVLSFFKNAGIRLAENERLMTNLKVTENRRKTGFKDQKMLAFHGNFVMNARLPEHIGLGKSVSRGFGTISVVNN